MSIEIRLNGEARQIPAPLSIAELLDHLNLPKEYVAVERNRSIVPKMQWESVALNQGDELEVVHFVGGGSGTDDPFVIAGRTFRSRLIVGTGKYPSNQVMAEAHRRSGTDMVTVAVRRIDLKAPKGQSLIDFIDREKIMILPNTAACYNVDDAVRTARLGWRAHEYRDRRRQGSRRDGRSHELRRESGPLGVPLRSHSAQALCNGIVPR